MFLIEIFERITVDFRHCYLFYRFLLGGEISEKVTISRKFKERVVQPILKVNWSTTMAVFQSWTFFTTLKNFKWGGQICFLSISDRCTYIFFCEEWGGGGWGGVGADG